MNEPEASGDVLDAPSPQLLQDTLKRMIRRVTDQVAADLLAERGMNAHTDSAPRTGNDQQSRMTQDPA